MPQVMTQNCKDLMMQKKIDFTADTFKLILMVPGFTFSSTAHNVYADLSASELPTANGYTAGGITLTSFAKTRDDANNRLTAQWGNATWNASGGTLAAADACIIDTTVAGSPVIAEGDGGGGTVTAVSGTPLIVANILLQLQ